MSEFVVTLMLLSIVASTATMSINIANQRLQYPLMLRNIKTAFIINANSAFSVATSLMRKHEYKACGRFAAYSGATIASAYLPLRLTRISVSAAL